MGIQTSSLFAWVVQNKLQSGKDLNGDVLLSTKQHWCEELHSSTNMENNSNYFHLRFAPNNISLGFQSHLYMIQQLLRVLKHLGINFLYPQLEICPLHYKMCLNKWYNLHPCSQHSQRLAEWAMGRLQRDGGVKWN